MSTPGSSHQSRRDENNNIEDEETPSTLGVSTSIVSGVPFVPVYAPPVGQTYGQHQQLQFPPPLPPQNYVDYGYPGYGYKTANTYPSFPPPPPQPPSLYYSRYATPAYFPTSSQPHSIMPQPQLVASSMNPGSRQTVGYNYGETYTSVFRESSTRASFTAHVLSLLFLQLFCSTLLSGLFLEVEFLNKVVKGTPWVVGLALLAALIVVVYWKLRTEAARKRPMDLYLFFIWSAALIVTLTWITSLLDRKFPLVVQFFLSIVLGSLLFGSLIMGTSLLDGKSTAFSLVVTSVCAILITVLYTRGVTVVFFALFTSSIVLLYFLFRLHYLMGDEWRKLQIWVQSLSIPNCFPT